MGSMQLYEVFGEASRIWICQFENDTYFVLRIVSMHKKKPLELIIILWPKNSV